MKIAYFGLPLGACLLLRQGHRLNLVVLAPASAPGRRRVRRLLERAGRPQLLDFASGAGDDDVESALGDAPPDLLLSWFWTRRLPAHWLALPALGALGLHPSLLPRHRGPNPYYAAIDAGDELTGVTLHRLEPEYDTGDILAQRSLPIGNRNAWQLARALDRPSLELLKCAADWAASGSLPAGRVQETAEVSWAGEPEGDQLRVDWNWAGARVLRRIRALSPVPGLALEMHGVKFFVTEARAAPLPALSLRAGEGALIEQQLVVRAGADAIRVDRATLADSLTELDGAQLASLLAEHASGVSDTTARKS